MVFGDGVPCPLTCVRGRAEEQASGVPSSTCERSGRRYHDRVVPHAGKVGARNSKFTVGFMRSMSILNGDYKPIYNWVPWGYKPTYRCHGVAPLGSPFHGYIHGGG